MTITKKALSMDWAKQARDPKNYDQFADWLNVWGKLYDDHSGESPEWKEGYRAAVSEAMETFVRVHGGFYAETGLFHGPQRESNNGG